jgi:hypothetical protein
MAAMEFRISEARPEARERLLEVTSQPRTSSVIADRKMAAPIFTASTVAGLLMTTFASSSWIDAPKSFMRPKRIKLLSGSGPMPIPMGWPWALRRLPAARMFSQLSGRRPSGSQRSLR